MIVHQTEQERMDWYETKEFKAIEKMIVDGIQQVCVDPSIWLDEELSVSGCTPDDRFYIEATLCDSCVRDGTLEGFNIIIEIDTQEGNGLKMYAPYNYTEDVWADNIEELHRRIKIGLELIPDELLTIEYMLAAQAR